MILVLLVLMSYTHSSFANVRRFCQRRFSSLYVRERLLFNLFYTKIWHQIKRQEPGFIKSRRSISKMIMYLDSVFLARDTNSPAISISFDLRKAFDSVSHQRLLPKFVNFGFDSAFLNLFNGYLTNSSQCVKINKHLSSLLLLYRLLLEFLVAACSVLSFSLFSLMIFNLIEQM